MGVLKMLVGVLGLFAIIGLIYPTSFHKTIVYKKVNFGQRKWNLAVFFVCMVLVGLIDPDPEVVAAKEETKKVQEQLDKVKKELEESNTKISQLESEKNICTTKLEPYLEIERKKQEELVKIEAEKKAVEEKKKQEEAAKLAAEQAKKQQEETATAQKTTTSTTTKTTTTTSSTSKPPYKGTSVTCSSFSSSAEATRYMNAYGVYKLDRDHDGIACESLN